jgi:hypothetical protein
MRSVMPTVPCVQGQLLIHRLLPSLGMDESPNALLSRHRPSQRRPTRMDAFKDTE